MLQSGQGRRLRTAAAMLLLGATTAVVLFGRVKIPTKRMEPASGGGSAEWVEEFPVLIAALRHKDLSRARQLMAGMRRKAQGVEMPEPVDFAALRRMLNGVGSTIRSNDYGAARRLAASGADKRMRSDLLEMVDFAEARSRLAKQDTEGARLLAGKLEHGIKRALLFAALAAQHGSAGKRTEAVACANSALEDVSRLEARHRRRLLAMVARAVMPVDREHGLRLLDRALHEGGAYAPEGSRWGAESGYVGSTPEAFVEVIGAGGVREAFSLAMPGMEGDLTRLLIENHGRLRCEHSTAGVAE